MAASGRPAAGPVLRRGMEHATIETRGKPDHHEPPSPESRTMLPATTLRVPENTAEPVNRAIRRRTEADIARVAAADPAPIDRALRAVRR